MISNIFARALRIFKNSVDFLHTTLAQLLDLVMYDRLAAASVKFSDSFVFFLSSSSRYLNNLFVRHRLNLLVKVDKVILVEKLFLQFILISNLFFALLIAVALTGCLGMLPLK